MTATDRRGGGLVGPLFRVVAVAVVYAVPLACTPALLYLVLRAYTACTGSEVIATEKRISQVLWLFALPLLSYALVAASFVPWRGASLAGHTLRVIGATALAGLVYLYLSARYFSLTQEACIDGLPTWWPAWLPAR